MLRKHWWARKGVVPILMGLLVYYWMNNKSCPYMKISNWLWRHVSWIPNIREGSTRRQGTEKQVEPDLSGPSSHVKDVDLVLWAKESHLRQSGSDISQLHLQSIILSTGRRMDGRGDIPHRIWGLLPQSTGTAQAHHQITLCSFSLKPLSLMYIFPLSNFLFFSIPAYSCGWM